MLKKIAKYICSKKKRRRHRINDLNWRQAKVTQHVCPTTCHFHVHIIFCCLIIFAVTFFVCVCHTQTHTQFYMVSNLIDLQVLLVRYTLLSLNQFLQHISTSILKYTAHTSWYAEQCCDHTTPHARTKTNRIYQFFDIIIIIINWLNTTPQHSRASPLSVVRDKSKPSVFFFWNKIKRAFFISMTIFMIWLCICICSIFAMASMPFISSLFNETKGNVHR